MKNPLVIGAAQFLRTNFAPAALRAHGVAEDSVLLENQEPLRKDFYARHPLRLPLCD